MNRLVKRLGSMVGGLMGAGAPSRGCSKLFFQNPEADLPTHALLAITYNCVAACPHCYLLQQDSSVFDVKRMMDDELFGQILSSPSFQKVSKVTFAGGEALLHPDIFTWIEEVAKKGIEDIATITNGLLLQKERVVSQLMDTTRLTHFNVSLDADNKDEYCRVKGIKSCDFDGIIEAVKALAARFRGTRTRVSGSFVLHTMSASDIRRLLLFGQSLGFHKITLHALHLVSGGDGNKEAAASLFRRVSDSIRSHDDYEVDVTVKVPVSVAEGTFYCPSLAKYMCVGADGVMAPCCHIPWGKVFGEFDGSSANVINHKSIMQMRNDFISAAENNDESLLPQSCRHCPKRARGNLSFSASGRIWSRT